MADTFRYKDTVPGDKPDNDIAIIVGSEIIIIQQGNNVINLTHDMASNLGAKLVVAKSAEGFR